MQQKFLLSKSTASKLSVIDIQNDVKIRQAAYVFL